MHTLVQIFTFKDGVLARLAHDLRLSASAFEITLHQGKISAYFLANSLEVDGVAHGEHVDPGALSVHDKQKIQHTIQADILDSARHPRIEVSGTLNQAQGRHFVEAELRLRGIQRPLEIPIMFADGKLTAECSFAPSAFGIAPYKALAGAIRLKDRVLVRVTSVANVAALTASQEPVVFTP
jgi:polyisoprenoid-binding protein YceI